MIKSPLKLDFSNTEIAFAGKSDSELKKTTWLFKVMNNPFLVKFGSFFGIWIAHFKIPIGYQIIKNTIFEQFCGGTNLLETQKTIDKLAENDVLSVLDFGAEGKETEKDLDFTMNEILRAIDFASLNDHVPVVSAKVTGIARFGLLEKMNDGKKLTEQEEKEYAVVLKRIDAICYNAKNKNVGIYLDAEESWIQNSIDDLVDKMMHRYNQNKVVVYNTFQLYRHDRLAFLKKSFEKAEKEAYHFGAKLVRGAYMDKERKRALDMGYPSPIHNTREETDRDFNDAIKYCLDHYEKLPFCNATHNQGSCMYMAEEIEKRGLTRNHPHLSFCQLYGMSDNLTFNLAKSGYNVAKYVPYGQVKDVVPYLIRRAQENSSVTGDMSREYSLLVAETKRRGI